MMYRICTKLIFSVILQLLLSALIIIITEIPSYSQTDNKINTVVIDAGHGGKDPGAIGSISYEKDIVLDIALKTGYYIEKNLQDVNVIYTRKTDKFVELHERAEIANSNSADLFISIHVNAHEDPTIKGTETYVMGQNTKDKNMRVAKQENSAILYEDNYKEEYEGYNPNSPENHIIFSLATDTYLEQSASFASMVQKQFRERAKRKDHGVKQAGLVVLWQTTMPSVLIETGFISNKSEELYLNREYGKNIIASAIFRGFRQYKRRIESNSELSEEKIVRNASDETGGYNQNSRDIFFGVQILSSAENLSTDSEQFNGVDVNKYKHNGKYKYYVGKSQNIEKIVRIKHDIREEFPNAFVVAFKNGRRISYRKAMKQLKN